MLVVYIVRVGTHQFLSLLINPNHAIVNYHSITISLSLVVWTARGNPGEPLQTATPTI